jgi:biotin carboxylase
VGANEFQGRLVVAANYRGFETHVFAWESGDVGEKLAKFFYPISITEKEHILAKCREIGIDGIVSIASDLAMTTVNFVANELGLISNSLHCTQVTTNKYSMRTTLESNGLPNPIFDLVLNVNDSGSDTYHYPLIVKPIDRSGSRGISLVKNNASLQTAIAKSKKCSFVDTVLIENYVDGKEYSIESISVNGHHQILQVTEKFTTGEPSFIETGHLCPARITKKQRDLIEGIVKRALVALDIQYGASHSEVKIQPDGEVVIIEIGARMGGDFIGSDLVFNSTGYDFVNAVLNVALGIPISDFFVQNNLKSNALIVYFFSEEEFLRFESIELTEHMKVLEISKNTNYTGLVSSSAERYGYALLTVASGGLDSLIEELKL